MTVKKIIIIGAGPAGMMAAIRASQVGAQVILIDKNSRPGRKLLLTGKGRSNLTNALELDLFIKRIFHGGDFLRDAFSKFFNQDLIRFFEERGVKLKTERQLRVFPENDRSVSIIDALEKEIRGQKTEFISNVSCKDIIVKDGSVKEVSLDNGTLVPADCVILATGGASYAFTGSTGDGISIARKLGHRIIPLRPGLVPLVTKEKFVRTLEGLVLKNISIKFSCGKEKVISEIGELLFTKSGISGPLVLSLSGKTADWLFENKEVSAEIDLKPALSQAQLNERLLREFKLNSKKALKNVLKELLPLSFVKCFLLAAGLDPEIKVSHVTQEERRKIIINLKSFRLGIAGTLPLEEAMVTKGGVSLKEINPRTMGSRLIKGLYFAGEIMDIDADTGGFNLQAAFSSGYLAGESAALS